MSMVLHRYLGKAKVGELFCTDFYADIGILPLFQMDSSKNQGLTVLFSLIFCICSIRSSFFYGKDAFPFGDGCFTLHGKINVFFRLSNALNAVFQAVEALNPGDIPVIKNTTIIMNAFDIWYKALIAVELERFIRKFCL